MTERPHDQSYLRGALHSMIAPLWQWLDVLCLTKASMMLSPHSIHLVLKHGGSSLLVTKTILHLGNVSASVAWRKNSEYLAA
ncbi:hypothetical protein A2T55_16355 [Brevibacterium linens]|uniref:Uncharacterized protein n=1 Tax=Brevibacterium linens TaxID=1703 RepID=A0A144MIL8_BRELN|nr:hypothetical protein A2T55_16355 [Brevibacterium linens]